MRLALLADIHANLEALEACMAHARKAGAEGFGFLGDLVGYGADPQAVLDAVRKELESGSFAVRGNHDAAIAGEATYLNRPARRAMEWTRRVLDAESMLFLARLPFSVRQGQALAVHGSAHRPGEWIYVDSGAEADKSSLAAQATWTLSGHVHEQKLYFESKPGHMGGFQPLPGTAIPVRGPRRWLALAGSVGQPRDGNASAAYALFDAAVQTLTFQRVAYDARAAAAKVLRAGLPKSIADRMERGI